MTVLILAAIAAMLTLLFMPASAVEVDPDLEDAITAHSQADALRAACKQVLLDKSLWPSGDETHCNQAVARVAAALGCRELDGLMADGIYALVSDDKNGRWTPCDGVNAAMHALCGGLAIAAMTSQQLCMKHGHVAVIFPLPLKRSPSLGRRVPFVANVGETVGIMLSSAAFPVARGEAKYFAWCKP